MITIGKKWPASAPLYDYTAMCDVCGVHWRRSQLRRDKGGRLVCPDDREKGPVALAELNARRGLPRRQIPPVDGNFDADPNPPYVHRTTAEDIES